MATRWPRCSPHQDHEGRSGRTNRDFCCPQPGVLPGLYAGASQEAWGPPRQRLANEHQCDTARSPPRALSRPGPSEQTKAHSTSRAPDEVDLMRGDDEAVHLGWADDEVPGVRPEVKEWTLLRIEADERREGCK